MHSALRKHLYTTSQGKQAKGRNLPANAYRDAKVKTAIKIVMLTDVKIEH